MKLVLSIQVVGEVIGGWAEMEIPDTLTDIQEASERYLEPAAVAAYLAVKEQLSKLPTP